MSSMMSIGKVLRVIARTLFATTLILAGLSLYNVFYPFFIQYIIENKIMILQNTSKFYHEWSAMKEPMKTEIFLFELTNARDFLRGKKAKVKEHGPFVFMHYKKRVNMTFLDDGKKISFQEMSIYHFDRSQSVAGLHDYNITVINLALMTTMHTLWKQTQSGLLNLLSPAVSSFTKEILSSNSEYITERRTPGQILVGRRARFIDQITRNLELARSLGVDVGKSPIMEMRRVGYFQFTNNTVGGPVVMYTGKRSFTEFVEEFVHHNRNNTWVRFYGRLFGYQAQLDEADGQEEAVLEKLDQQYDRGVMKIASFDGKKYYGKFLRPNCNEIKGTDGTLNNNYFVREEKSLFLHADICRPLKLIFDSKKMFDTFNSANRYVLDPETFVSKRENWCFCPGVKAVRQRSPRTCTRSRSGSVTCRMVAPKNATVIYKITGDLQRCTGYHDMATCNEFLPIAVTSPHFLNSPKLLKAVDGLSPDYDEHGSYVTIEPTFGVTMEARVKMQVNVRTHPAASIENYDKFKPTIMPYLWVIESGGMTADTRRTLSFAIAFIYVGYWICVIIILVGVLALTMLVNSVRQRKGPEFLDIDKYKRNLSVKFEYNSKEHESVWNQKEMLQSKLRKSKNMIERKRHSSTSLNQILPAYGKASPEPISGPDGRYGSFESSRPIALKEERIHSNHTQRSVHSSGSLTPLG